MSKTVEFYFDFGSPNAYIAYHALPGIAQRTGAEIAYRPCLLGGVFKSTGNKSPFEAYGTVQAKMAYEGVDMQRFIDHFGLTRFQFNPNFPVNTILLMRGMIWAQKADRVDEYLAAGFAAMWEDGKAMGDAETFAAVMTDHGLPGDDILAATQDPAIKEALFDVTAKAVERGIFGIPTFFIGDDMYFGKDRLWMVDEALEA